MGVNPIRKRRGILHRPAESPFGFWARNMNWYAICPTCDDEIHDRPAYGLKSTRKRAKDALYDHSRTHEPSLVDTATPRNA